MLTRGHGRDSSRLLPCWSVTASAARIARWALVASQCVRCAVLFSAASPDHGGSCQCFRAAGLLPGLLGARDVAVRVLCCDVPCRVPREARETASGSWEASPGAVLVQLFFCRRCF